MMFCTGKRQSRYKQEGNKEENVPAVPTHKTSMIKEKAGRASTQEPLTTKVEMKEKGFL